MANYTIQLRDLIAAGFTPALTAYPIYDSAYRAVLNAKIIKRYSFREIGLETPDLFNFFLDMRMGEIMPRYNKLYLAEALIFNPLFNTDLAETTTRKTENVAVGQSSSGEDTTTSGTGTATGTGSGTSTETGSGTATGTGSGTATGTWSGTTTHATVKNIIADSDTPQGSLTIMDLESGGYASKVEISEQSFDVPDETTNAQDSATTSAQDNATTNAQDIATTTAQDSATTNAQTGATLATAATASEGTTTDDYVRHVAGYQGQNPTEMLMKYRDSLINIDVMIIESLNDLFMGVY